MQIKQIEIENFRPFYGIHRASFSIDQKKSISIFRAPNNWGKTSVFEAIKWCLYNYWPPINARGHSVNDEAIDEYEKSCKSFSVSVSIDFEHSETLYRFKRYFKYNDNYGLKNSPDNEVYLSSIKKDGKLKKIPGISDYQTFIDNVLPPQVSKYFIVDGDDFRSFTDPTGNQTKEAIEKLLNFTIVQRTVDHLRSSYNDYQAEYARLAGTQTSKDIVKLIKETQSKLDTLVSDYEKENKQRASAYGNYKEISASLQKITLNKKTIDKIDILESENEKYDFALITTINNLAKNSSLMYKFLLKKELNKIFSGIKKLRENKFNIYPFNLRNLKDVISACNDHGKINCLCGSEITKNDEKYKSIIETLEHPERLSHDTEATNLMEHIQDCNTTLTREIKKYVIRDDTYILQIQQRKEVNLGEIKRLKQERVTTDTVTGANIVVLEDLHKKAELSHNRLDIDCQILKNKIDEINNDLKDLQKKLSRIQTSDERSSKIKNTLLLLETTLKSLEEKYDVYRMDKKNQLKKKISHILFRMYTASSNFSKFTIDDDFEYDVLNNRGKSWKKHLSNGQRKILSVAFVAGLKNVAEEDAPYIIDSPLNAVSKDHQKNYATILPDLSSQLIMFITDTEIIDEAYKILQPKIGSLYDIEYDSVTNRSKFKEIKGE
jgi:DNA sulfur modification protein DndD